MIGPMELEAYELAKQHLLKAAFLVAPNADVRREFIANLNDLEDEHKWSRRQIIYALCEALKFWAEFGVEHELRPIVKEPHKEEARA